MRVVVDTNVFVSTALKDKSLPALAVRIVEQRGTLLDDKFLELAVNGHADFIVSGDPDLLVLNPFRDIPIVAPAPFVQAAAR